MTINTMSGDSLEALGPLIGEWRLVATFKDLPPADIGARVTFEWLPGERFLIQRWEVPIPEAPDGIAIIGADPAHEGIVRLLVGWWSSARSMRYLPHEHHSCCTLQRPPLSARDY